MKLDKIKFAKVVSWISQITNGLEFAEDDLRELDNIIDIQIPEASQKASCADVDELLRQLNVTDGFIPAIKAYRYLTGAGLKESKEAIERYRNVPKFPEKKPDDS